jgi:hypothetical protein
MQAPPPRSILPVVVGIVLTIVLLAGLGYLAQLRRNATPNTPALTVIRPTSEPLDSPFVVEFNSSEPLELTPNGWVADAWHLHARVNGVEYMPAAAEITSSGNTYRWTLPAVPRGPVSFKLGWADQRHREVSTGSSDVVETIVR